MTVWTPKTTTTTIIVLAAAAAAAAVKSARMWVASCRMQRRSRRPSVCRCPEVNQGLDEGKCGPAAPVGQSSWTRIRVVRAVKSARPTVRHRQLLLRENSPSIPRPSSVSSLKATTVWPQGLISFMLLSSSARCDVYKYLQTDALSSSRQLAS